MPRFGLVPLGLALVLLDINLGTLDVLPDSIGWLLVYLGLGGGAAVDVAFHRARWLALLGALLALVTVVTGQGALGALGVPLGVVEVLVPVLVSHGIAQAASPVDEVSARRGRFFRNLLAVYAVAVVVGLLTTVTLGAADEFGPLVLVVLAGLFVMVAFVVFLAVVRDRPWLRTPQVGSSAA